MPLSHICSIHERGLYSECNPRTCHCHGCWICCTPLSSLTSGLAAVLWQLVPVKPVTDAFVSLRSVPVQDKAHAVYAHACDFADRVL